MRHKIEMEEFTRESDGHSFSRVTLRDLAGADNFAIVCLGETPNDALLQMAHRLRLVSDDARDIAGRLFDKTWSLADETHSSARQSPPALHLVDQKEDKEVE